MHRERFPRHRFQRKPLVIDPGMHHGTCVTHVPWCISGSLTQHSRRMRNTQFYVSGKAHWALTHWHLKKLTANLKILFSNTYLYKALEWDVFHRTFLMISQRWFIWWHSVNQCWPASVTPCGVIRPRWVELCYSSCPIHSKAGLENSRYELGSV